MKGFFTLTILLTALTSIYAASAWHLPRQLTGVQLDPLPALMLVVALRAPISAVTALAIGGSLLQSALSSGPVGASLVPLYALGLVIHLNAHSLSQYHIGPRFALGAIAGGVVPALTLVLLVLSGHEPLIGWFTLWQWSVGILGSGIFAVLFFPLLEWLDRSVEEQPLAAPYDTTTRIVRGTKFHG